MEGVIPPTDCRLRPDIRAMENGDIGEVYDRHCHTSVNIISGGILISVSMPSFIDLASAEKKRLEEKQRMARKNRTKSTDEWKTRLVTEEYDGMPFPHCGPVLITSLLSCLCCPLCYT